jgi:diguanylate cyclase (GGDEF)-like protein
MAVGDYLAVALNNARLYERVRTLADTDTLTRLLTRRAFFLESERVLVETAGNGGVVSSLILDIDHFKRINDECGHQVGDRVIEVVAAAFRTGLRSKDVIGRYGGEEFCAILPGVSIHEAQLVGERICAEIRELADQPAPWPVTVSIGISACDPATESEPTQRILDRLIGEADEALYRAKRNGRDRVEASL